MNAYAIYAGKRLLQFALVVFIGINLAFVITHSTPIDPVEQTVATATAFGSTSPEAVEMMRQSLARALRARRQPVEPIRGVLEADRGRRFRPLAVGLPDAGLGPDQPRVAVDDRAPDGLDPSGLDAGKPAGRPCRLLPRQQDPEDRRHRRDGHPSDPLLHRGLRAPDRVRLSSGRCCRSPAAPR